MIKIVAARETVSRPKAVNIDDSKFLLEFFSFLKSDLVAVMGHIRLPKLLALQNDIDANWIWCLLAIHFLFRWILLFFYLRDRLFSTFFNALNMTAGIIYGQILCDNFQFKLFIKIIMENVMRLACILSKWKFIICILQTSLSQQWDACCDWGAEKKIANRLFGKYLMVNREKDILHLITPSWRFEIRVQPTATISFVFFHSMWILNQLGCVRFHFVALSKRRNARSRGMIMLLLFLDLVAFFLIKYCRQALESTKMKNLISDQETREKRKNEE